MIGTQQHRIPTHRMYVDEVGTHDMGPSCSDVRHRYLSLTGVAFELKDIKELVVPKFSYFKRRHFNDSSISLHRREIVMKRDVFACLRDPEMDRNMRLHFCGLLDSIDFTAFTVTLDKRDFKAKYTRPFYPYHYCLHVLIERYAMWLSNRNSMGDVMAEARVSNVDRQLSRSHRRVYSRGTDYMDSDYFQSRLTSGEIKLRTKRDSEIGLEIADLAAHAGYCYTRNRYEGTPYHCTFSQSIAQILEESKFDRKNGQLDGFGVKWLP